MIKENSMLYLLSQQNNVCFNICLRTCRFSNIILSKAWIKSSSSAQATCFRPPPRIITSYMAQIQTHILQLDHLWTTSCLTSLTLQVTACLRCFPRRSRSLCWSLSDSQCSLPPRHALLPHSQSLPACAHDKVMTKTKTECTVRFTFARSCLGLYLFAIKIGLCKISFQCTDTEKPFSFSVLAVLRFHFTWFAEVEFQL